MATITDIKAASTGQSAESTSVGATKTRPAFSTPTGLFDKLQPHLLEVAKVRQRPLFVLASSFINPGTCSVVYEWRNELRDIGKRGPFDLLIHSPGGDLSSCYLLGRLLSRWTDSWSALVPSIAASGATLTCLGSEEIVMAEIAQLGPLDPQVISKRRERFFAVERQSPLEAFQAVRYLRQFSLESLDATMKFLLEHMITPQHALEIAAKLSAQLVQPILDKIDPYDLGAFSLDSRVSSQYCHRLSQPQQASRKGRERLTTRRLSRNTLHTNS